MAHDWDLVGNAGHRRYWLDIFARHFEDTMNHAAYRHGKSASSRIESAGKKFAHDIEMLRREPALLRGGKLNIMELCSLREKNLLEHDLLDPFKHIKDRENAAAAGFYAKIIREIHAMDGLEKWLRIIRGVFAGNIFDLGAPAVMHKINQSADFQEVLQNIKPRPWLVDNFDLLCDNLPHSRGSKWTKAVVFIDNAGSDFILGIMPLVRELALAGTQIVLAANELPTLNDLTADETFTIVESLAEIDPPLLALLEAEMISVVSTGNDIPLIDLAEVSDELNESAGDCDLVIIEGMGRAIESNFDASFNVDCLKLALLKDELVASRIGGKIYDCVCKFERQVRG